VIFNDRRFGVGLPPVKSHLDRLYGSHDIEAMFPEGISKTSVPWQQAGRSTKNRSYENEKVGRTLSTQATTRDLTEFDPRTLRANQPHLIRPAVQHYMGRQFEEHGATFEQGQNAGNKWPVVYTRHSDEHEDQHIILSGHHRAASSLLRGRPLWARHVEGGWGDRYDKPLPPWDEPR
jgi:hypothetical protein